MPGIARNFAGMAPFPTGCFGTESLFWGREYIREVDLALPFPLPVSDQSCDLVGSSIGQKGNFGCVGRVLKPLKSRTNGTI